MASIVTADGPPSTSNSVAARDHGGPAAGDAWIEADLVFVDDRRLTAHFHL